MGRQLIPRGAGLLALCALVGCGDDASDDGPNFVPDEGTFGCITDWIGVRGFYITNVLTDPESSAAVARGEAPLPYPPGTVIQLVPQEAMVKRQPGFSEQTADWEFFFLDDSAGTTRIDERGTTEVTNVFGGNCFSCHEAARDNDFVCEQDHGCIDLPIGEEQFRLLQDGDRRCAGN